MTVLVLAVMLMISTCSSDKNDDEAAGNKVVMGPGTGPDGSGGTSILIVDTESGKVDEIKNTVDGTTISQGRWGEYSTAVVGNKVVMGPGDKGTSILIVDTKSGKVNEIKKASDGTLITSGIWGYDSVAVVGNKVVMGPGSGPDGLGGTSILIVDTVAEKVSQINVLIKAEWGSGCTAVAGKKVVMGPGGTNYINSILIIDPFDETTPVKKITEAFNGTITISIPASPWGCSSMAVVGDKKVIMGTSSARPSILIVDVEAETIRQIGGLSDCSWGRASIAVFGNKVVMGGGKNSVLIVDAFEETFNEITMTVNSEPITGDFFWGSQCTAVAGNKVVMGPGKSGGGNSILIVNPYDETVNEIKKADGINITQDRWGFESMAVVDKKVVMGRAGNGYSILIVDTFDETVSEIEITHFPEEFAWGLGNCMGVTGKKVVMGSSSAYDPTLVINTETGGVSKTIDGAAWGGYSTAVVGNKVIMGRGGSSKGNSILIVEGETGTEKIVSTTNALWGYNSMVVAGNKVVMGRGSSEGNSILIIDADKGTVTEKGGLSGARWGYGSTDVLGKNTVLVKRVPLF